MSRRGGTRSLPRTWLVLGALAVIAGGAVVGAIVMTGSAPQELEAAPAAVAQASTTDDANVAMPVQDAAEPASLPLVTYEVFLSRDPFEPVVPEDQPTGTGDGGTDTGTGDGGTGTGGDSGTGTGGTGTGDAGSGSGGGDGGSGATDACSGTTEVVCDGQVVTLLDVTTAADGTPIAVIQVGTTVYEVSRGQTFAGNFQVRAIDGSCVSLLFGDDGFQLCTGDTVLK